MLNPKTCYLASSFIAFILLIFASIQDEKQRRVSDLFPVAICIDWIIFALIGALNALNHLLFAFLVFVILLSLTIILEKVKNQELLGGGDIKIISALCLYMSLNSLFVMLFIASISSIVKATYQRHRQKRQGKLYENFSSITVAMVPSITIGFVFGILWELIT